MLNHNDVDTFILHQLNNYDLYHACYSNHYLLKICKQDRILERQIKLTKPIMDKIDKILRIIQNPTIYDFEEETDEMQLNILDFSWEFLYDVGEIDFNQIMNIYKNTKHNVFILMDYDQG